MLYKNSVTTLTRSQFILLRASVEFALPRVKGQLHWSHAVVAGWSCAAPVRHTVPLGKSVSKLMAVFMAADGYPRLGLGLVLQAHTGLRPSELLGLKGRDVSFPEDSGKTLEETPCVLALGATRSTKVKRTQTVLLDSRLSDIVLLLRFVVSSAGADGLLFPSSLDQYRSAIRKIEARLRINAGWGSHSPRAGFASDSRAEGWALEAIRETGRWRSDQSLRTYLDVVSAKAVLVQLRSAGWAEALAWCDRGWVLYFEVLTLADAPVALQAGGREVDQGRRAGHGGASDSGSEEQSVDAGEVDAGEDDTWEGELGGFLRGDCREEAGARGRVPRAP